MARGSKKDNDELLNGTVLLEGQPALAQDFRVCEPVLWKAGVLCHDRDPCNDYCFCEVSDFATSKLFQLEQA